MQNRTVTLLMSCLLLAASIPAAAEEPGYRTHVVEPGDTLYGLAKQYTGTKDTWREIQLRNEVKNPRRLKPGSELLIPLPSPSVTVIYVEGDVQVLDSAAGITSLQIGQKLQEETKVSVGKNSYLSLEFADGSVVRVMSNSTVLLAEVREQSKTATRKLELERGTLDVSVTPRKHPPKRKYKPNSFEVITPGAVAAVRGTRFNIAVSPEQKTTSGVTEGTVGVSSNKTDSRKKNPSIAVAAGFGIPVNADGTLGDIRPLLPAPQLEQMKSTQDADYVSLEWPETPNAKAYGIQVAKDTNPEHVLRNAESTEPRIRLAGLTDGSYSLSVKPIDPDDVVGFEARQAFKIKTSPAYPLFIQPGKGGKSGPNAFFECTPVSGAEGYHIQISSERDFRTLIADPDNLKACSYTAEQLPPGRYYWRVAAKSSEANGALSEGPFSLPTEFEIDGSLAEEEMDVHPTLFWEGQPGINYMVQISQDEKFSQVVKEFEASENLVETDDLEPGVYFLRLRARDESGMMGNVTLPRQFEIKSSANEAIGGPSVERTWFDKSK
ncbi:MAG TPA: FecR domain-containing protein [Methylophilaceae bacterium]|nr:FecR domain-containing protein [Methylophilaceae bacterium]